MNKFVKALLLTGLCTLPCASIFSEQALPQQWGNAISNTHAISITEAIERLSNQPDSQQGFQQSSQQGFQQGKEPTSHVVVIAKVDSICEKKGCWLSLVDPTKKTSNVRVKFKDYGFFVPPSLFGKTVKVEGELQQVQLSLAESKHFVADGGGDPNTVTAPINEFQLVATGVELIQ